MRSVHNWSTLAKSKQRMHSLSRRIVAELIGTALLVAAVIGSGIMAERLSNGNIALALLANTIATGAALVALILAFGPISGAHFNPAVSISDAVVGGLSRSIALLYVAAQCVGGLLGAAIAHLMFSVPLYSLSVHARNGWAQVFSEFVAALGLMAVIWGCSKARPSAVPLRERDPAATASGIAPWQPARQRIALQRPWLLTITSCLPSWEVPRERWCWNP